MPGNAPMGEREMKDKLAELRKELDTLTGKAPTDPKVMQTMLGVMCDLLDLMIERLEKK